MCGERVNASLAIFLDVGSSPRVRGTHLYSVCWREICRFIPACAGNALKPPTLLDVRTVHPRVCGERTRNHGPICLQYGSSPRVRGTLRKQRHYSRNSRFIPACAGNAFHQHIKRKQSPVHPRVCGERQIPHRLASCHNGSSPRVRGTPIATIRTINNHRFIPACAGNAIHQNQKILDTTVHPRVCGERAENYNLILCLSGSSPRVRGTPPFIDKIRADARFIPACAGNA